MGSNISRTGEIDENPAPKIEGGSEPSTPILANKVVKLVNEELDPRSPSSSIARTPIQFLSTPEIDQKELTPKLVDKLQILTGELDPRSPTTDFTRTPILIAADDDKSKIPRKICNKNLEVVRRSGIQNTPHRRPKSTSNLPVVAPKLLDSSPVSPKPVKSKRKSFVGLLETNIDYTETNLDEVLKSQYQSPKNNPEQVKEEFSNEIKDPRSPTMDFARTPLQITNEMAEIDLNKENIEKEAENASEIIATDLENDSDSNEIVDHSLKEVSNQNNLTDNQFNDNQTKIVDLTHDVREFDKKLMNLIYEDTTILQTPPKNKTASKEAGRTPLGIRNLEERNTIHSEPMKKTANKLKVSDRPRKSEISKIPVFKEKGRRVEVAQCENTPPKQLRQRKRVQPIQSQWDTADKTLII